MDQEQGFLRDIKYTEEGGFLRNLSGGEMFFAVLGILVTVKITAATAWNLAVGIRAHLWSRLWKRNLKHEYGEWAVVTGSTDGIGKSYAKELAKNGMNVLLISRTKEKLESVAKEIGDEFGVETEIVQADFSNGLPIYENIAKHLQNKEIGILVNNVGIMLGYPQIFNEVSERDIWGHINVNMASVCAMTKLVLPEMLARKRGAIVNIASIAASGPIPLMGIYAASKAFVEYFSLALENEYCGTGITVQTVCPSYVATNMTSFSSLINTPSLVTPSADTFAASAVRTIGYTSLTSGFWTHGIQSWIVNTFCPRWLFMIFMKTTNKLLLWDHKKSKQ